MKILLDTHAFLWAITGDERLGPRAKAAFLHPESRLFLSLASLWEICVKLSLGKLLLQKDWQKTVRREMKANIIQWLPD